MAKKKKVVRPTPAKTRRPKSVLPTVKISVRLPQLHADALKLLAQQRGLSLTEALEVSLEEAFKAEAWAEVFQRERHVLRRLQSGESSLSNMLPEDGADEKYIAPFDYEWEDLKRLGHNPEVRAYTFGDYHRILTRIKLENLNDQEQNDETDIEWT